MHKPSSDEIDLLVGLWTCGNRTSSETNQRLKASATHIRRRSSAWRSEPKLMRLCLARLGEVLITFLASSLAAARTSRSGYSRALYGHIRIAVEDSHDGFRFAEVAQVA